MYLIDTSIWIDYFREVKNASTQRFSSILEQNIPFGITSIIYQEILQGAATEYDFNQLKEYLITQRFFQPKDEVLTYESAAKLLLYEVRLIALSLKLQLNIILSCYTMIKITLVSDLLFQNCNLIEF